MRPDISHSLPIELLESFSVLLTASFDNFQQCWQQQTEEEQHQVSIKKPHRHWHLDFEPLEQGFTGTRWWKVNYFEERNSAVGKEEFWRVQVGENGTQLHCYHYQDQAASDQAHIRSWIWKATESGFIAENASGKPVAWLDQTQLRVHFDEGVLAHPDNAYCLLRCRYFAGWIEAPIPGKEEEMHRQGNLQIHDQGGLIKLLDSSSNPSGNSVELTQLVYGKQIAIMKLAIYQEEHSGISYNSKAISYTWTNPEAKRIGINLRFISSGWTLIEPGFINSDRLNQ